MATTHYQTVRNAQALTGADVSTLAEELRRGVKGEVRADKFNRLLYATDASLYQMEPIAVVFPTDAGDVQHVLRVAARERCAPTSPTVCSTPPTPRCTR